MPYKENTLEVDNVALLSRALRLVRTVLRNTKHSNRDTQILDRVEEELEGIIEWNTEEG